MKKFVVIKHALILFALVLSIQAWGQDIPEGYYDNAIGKKKAELKTALFNIIKKANVLGYGSGAGKTWSGFVQVDVDKDGYYVDMYSPNRVKANGNSAGSGMNIEHSFAKSWWGRTKNQAYQDIQQLRPSNSTANSSKGSWPMAEVDGDGKYNNGVIKVGKSSNRPGGSIDAWEPSDEFKGDFARIYMYMVTCYEDFDQKWTGNSAPQLDNNTYPVFEPWTVDLLMKWTREDPVSDWEIQRNDKVYLIQGNRNPYVDYPELAEYVWGDRTDTEWIPGGSNEPVIVSPKDGSEIEMGATAVNMPLAKTVKVRARNLDEDIAVAITGTGFSVDAVILSRDEVSSGKDITVTYSSPVAAQSDGSLTLTSGSLNATVMLKAEAVDGIPALPAMNVMTTSFIAAWTDLLGGKYALLVFASDGTTLLNGYPKDVDADAEEYAVTGLEPNTTYFYQLSQNDIYSNKVKVTTAAPVPVLSTSFPDGDLDFITIPGKEAVVKRVNVYTEYVEHDIEASIGEPFVLSTDKENWTSTLTLDKEGGTIYVRMPSSEATQKYETVLTLSVADIPEEEEVDVTGIIEAERTFFEDFEKSTKTSYGLGNVQGTMCEWAMDDGGIWAKNTFDHANGSQAARLGKNKTSGSYLSMCEDRPRGIQSVSFYAGVGGNDAASIVAVSYSTDGGNKWNEVKEFEISKADKLTQYVCPIGIEAPARLKFEKKSGGRFNIDDVAISDYLPSSIEKNDPQKTVAYTTEGHLVLVMSISTDVYISSLSGMKIYHRALSPGTTRIALPNGIYIVRIGEKAEKILVP